MKILRHKPAPAPEFIAVTVDSLPEPLMLPAAAVRAITTAALPAILKHKSVALVLGDPRSAGRCSHCGK